MSPRIRAFLFHLAISFSVALVAVLVVFCIWYPAPLHIAVGVTHIFLLLLLVDLTLGPLLTLLVYKRGKRTLVFDLGVIGLLQIAALTYGLWAVAQGRPAWLVFNVDRFDLVRVVDIDTRRVSDAALGYANPSWLGPKWVAALAPENTEERNALLLESVLGGVDVAQRPNLYLPLEKLRMTMASRFEAVSELKRFNDSVRVDAILGKWPEADVYLPLMAPARPMVVLLKRESAEVIAVVDLNPWDEL